jgi:hypothetical protein
MGSGIAGLSSRARCFPSAVTIVRCGAFNVRAIEQATCSGSQTKLRPGGWFLLARDGITETRDSWAN